MLQDNDLKMVKDKKLRALYQIIYIHLKHIEDLASKDELLEYQSLFKAYKNGYTSNNKTFKSLLKSHINFSYIYIDWLNVFIESKIYYLEIPKLKHLDDLFKFAELQSKIGFMFLITDKLAKHHLSIINNISKIDVISFLLLHDSGLKENTLIYYPLQLVEDFGIELSMDGSYMKNEKYVALWEYLHFKIQGFIKEIEPLLIQFQDHEVLIINDFIKTIQFQLITKRNTLIKHLKSLQ